MTIKLNQKIENFCLAATGNQEICLSDFVGKKIVLYFYPKDNTPGCTTEGKDFRDNFTEFTNKNTVILGVSRDSVKVHEGFKNKHNFPFDLLSDKEETLCQQFDVIKLKKLYGREYLGLVRSTFLIDENGILIKEWRNVKVKGHVAEVLSYC